MEKAVIMDIQRFSIHDGPGIRTTVFFKGCHMACAWCHNPESQRREPEMLFYRERCMGCASCLPVCKRQAHRLEGGIHEVELSKCRDCPDMAACSQSCPAGALRLCGEKMDAPQVLSRVLADRDFYGTEGGVTCSGGESLLQEKFLEEFLPLCKEQGISTCLDTTLNVAWESVERILPWTDLFLADLKFAEEEAHLRYTGRSGRQTLENLRRLSDVKKPVILRMPLIAGINDTPKEAEERRKLLRELSNIKRVDCFAVTGHGAAKYRALQRSFQDFNRGRDLERLVENMREQMGINEDEGSDILSCVRRQNRGCDPEIY